jgi:hypothetical protein
MKNTRLFCSMLLVTPILWARTCELPPQWQMLCSVLEERTAQLSPKMKLTESQAKEFENFVRTTSLNFSTLKLLQSQMPKTTVELIMCVHNRGVSAQQADLMGRYLQQLISRFRFKQLALFDNNTSHIIGKDWHEINYSGEGMTWQIQKKKYAPYGITNFKRVQNLKKFFPVEAKLPYFTKVYGPTGI